METGGPAPTHAPTLPSNRAFVVQFRVGTADGSDDRSGRVEHLTSGQAARFASLEELLAFMARVLDTVRAPPLEES